MDITVENLTHVYGAGTPFERFALGPVDLHLVSGSFTAIIGQTGSGKSTLIQHMNGLLRPTGGAVTIGDFRVGPTTKKGLRELRRKVGLVFQYPEYQLFEETVEKDIAYGPKNFNLPEDLIQARVREAMELVDLDYEQFKDLSPLALSGGQMRRVALAGVLALQPKVMILDEPTAGLDPHGKKEILQRLYKLHKKEHWTTILVTHNMEDAARYADRIVVMKDGKVWMEGTPSEVFRHSEAIREIGLDLPEITDFITKLNDRMSHNPIPADIFSIDKLEQEIVKRWKGAVAKR